MTKLKFFLGYPVDFQKICLVYPPLVKDVIVNDNYYIYLKLLTLSQEEIEDEYVKSNISTEEMLTPFEYLLNCAYNDKNLKRLIEDAFMFFIHEPILFIYEQKQILLGEVSEIKAISDLRVLTEDNYFDFQNLIRQSIGQDKIEPPDPNENPRIKILKAKARYRDKIKAKQGGGLKLETILASISCMNFSLNPLNIGELSYAAVPVLCDFYQNKEKYELDIKSLLAGADSKKVKPKYWIRNSEK